MPDYYHLAIAWDWEHDADFVAMLEAQMHAQRMLSYSISHHNVQESLKSVQKGELQFGAFLDRAADGDEKFPPFAKAIRKTPALSINSPDHVQNAIDKATMHLEFITKGIEVPFSVIISPFNKKKEVELRLSDIAKLGWPFIMKPANTTGGGVGVILNAASLNDVIATRQFHKNDKYLLQEKIVPALMHGRKAWFRVFSIFGTVLPCWWDDETHIYTIVTKQDMTSHHLRSLITITKKILDVSKLDFFSTEIAVTAAGRFVVVDYVNEICDMRLQSKHVDGVPDVVVTEICKKIARYLRSTLRPI